MTIRRLFVGLACSGTLAAPAADLGKLEAAAGVEPANRGFADLARGRLAERHLRGPA